MPPTSRARSCSRASPGSPTTRRARASRLPGWSRGHLLSHLARNADGVRGMVEGAIVGEEREQYPHGARGPGRRHRRRGRPRRGDPDRRLRDVGPRARRCVAPDAGRRVVAHRAPGSSPADSRWTTASAPAGASCSCTGSTSASTPRPPTFRTTSSTRSATGSASTARPRPGPTHALVNDATGDESRRRRSDRVEPPPTPTTGAQRCPGSPPTSGSTPKASRPPSSTSRCSPTRRSPTSPATARRSPRPRAACSPSTSSSTARSTPRSTAARCSPSTRRSRC